MNAVVHVTATPADTPPRFLPRPGLRNAHVQTLLASLRPRHPDAVGMGRASVQRILDCGQGVKLSAAHAHHPQAQSAVVLIHGWEGCQDSTYLHALACVLYADGHSVVRLNLRDHGGSHALNEQPFHSARIDEVIGACRAVEALEPGLRLICIGFSLGGNFALRVGLHGPAQGLTPALSIGISPAIDPRATVEAIDRNPVYRRYFLRRWRADLVAKMQAWPGRYDGFAALARLDRFLPATYAFARDFTEYEGGDDYLAAYTLSAPQLMAAPSPLAIITARDDPMIPFSSFAGLRSGDSMRALITPAYGGHCGFIDNWHMHCWTGAAVRRLLHSTLQPGTRTS